MMDSKTLTELTREIMTHGYDEARASHFAVLLGDTPLKDLQGRVLVMDGAQLLATLPPLKFYAES